MRVLKRLAWLFVSLIIVGAVLVYAVSAYDAYGRYKADLDGYMGLSIGASMDEAMYEFGYPQWVLAPAENFPGIGLAMPVIQVDGKDPKNAMPQGKSVKDYDSWEINRSGHRLDVTFDPKTKRVTEVGCYVNPDTGGDRDCPSIFGVDTQTTDDELASLLGDPDGVKHDGVSKTLRYDSVGLELKLAQRRVYMITKTAAKGASGLWKLKHIFL